MPSNQSCFKKKSPRTSLKIWVKSLGCPKNTVDTERLVGQLGLDVLPVQSPRQADIVFVNTCGFIEPAVRESVRTILDLAKALEGGKRKPLLAVAGCMVGRYGREALQKDLPEVDIWLEPKTRDSWGEMLLNAVSRPYHPSLRRLSTAPSYSYLKVSEGCRHHCAFCTIPSIRGPLHSSPKEQLLEEARYLAGQGVKELVLIAQDLTDYGHDLGSDGNVFPDLVRSLGEIDDIRWLRMLYLYPNGITPELLKTVREVPSLLPYFDMPLQHSHPDILKNMGRPFAVEPEKVCDKIREAIPDAALRTTFIVGYPGETDAHFRHLCDFVEKTGFTQLGVFTFWPEEGTKAASLPDQVEDHVKIERRNILMELQQDISRDFLETQVGTSQDVLVDSVNPEWPGLHNGRVWFQAPDVDGMCYISGPGVQPGAMVRADIVESQEYDLSALAPEL